MSRPDNLWARHCDAETRAAVTGVVTGTIPSWLTGRLVRNGPGGKHVGNETYTHLFDGLSVLHLVDIADGKVTYTSRYLESENYSVNHRANRIVRTEFGTAGIPDPCLGLFDKMMTYFTPTLALDRTSDNCSVNVMQVKDQMIAMTELDVVRIIDPVTLDTLPQTEKYTDYVSVQRATAHPHIEGDVAYNLAMSSKGGPQYSIVQMAEGKVSNSKMVASVASRWKLHPGYLHSFGITDNYFIISETPMAIDAKVLALPSFAGMSAFNAMKYYGSETTRFRIMDRKTGKEIKTVAHAPGFFNFHYFNCYETQGKLVLDVCAADDHLIEYLKMDNLAKSKEDKTRSLCNIEPRRYIIPIEGVEEAKVGENLLANFPEATVHRDMPSATAMKQKTGELHVTGVTLAKVFMELPRINYKFNKKNYTFGYGATVDDFDADMFDIDGITKINVKTGETIKWTDPEFFASEPVFVEAPEPKSEDDGVLLCVLISKENPRACALLVLDAATMKEVARADFTAAGTVSSTFHGQFVDPKLDYQLY